MINETFQKLRLNFEIDNNELQNLIYDFYFISLRMIYSKMENQINEIESLIRIDLESEKVERQKPVLTFMKKYGKKQDNYLTYILSQYFPELRKIFAI